MKIPGILDGQKVSIEYNSNGFEFYGIVIHIASISFKWIELDSMQQIQIYQQLEQTLPRVEENYN